MCFSDSPLATPLNTIVDLKNILHRRRLLLLLVKLRMDHKLFARRAQAPREPQDTLHTKVHQHPVCAHLGSPRALALPEVARIAALASPVLCGLPLLRSGLTVCLGWVLRVWGGIFNELQKTHRLKNALPAVGFAARVGVAAMPHSSWHRKQLVHAGNAEVVEHSRHSCA